MYIIPNLLYNKSYKPAN